MIQYVRDGWAVATLPDLAGDSGLMTDGDWVETEDQDPAGAIRLIQLADVGDGIFKDRSQRFLTEMKSRELRCTILKPGDVLIARMPDPLGRACVFPGLKQLCCTVVDVCILRPGDEDISSRWLMYFLNAPQFRIPVAGLQSGSTRKRISKKNLSTVPFLVPPKEEQRRIADTLDSYLTRLDAAAEGLKRVESNLERYRASVLKAAIEGRLVPTEADLAKEEGRVYQTAAVLLARSLKERRRRWEDAATAKMKEDGERPKNDKWKAKYEEPAAPDTSTLPTLPEGWCWATIEQLASHLPRSIQSGPFGSALLHSEFQAEGMLVVGIDNVQDGYFSLGSEHRIAPAKFEVLRKFAARPRDVLVTVMATIGRTCVVPDELEQAIITKHVYRISCDSTLVESRYLHLALWGGPSVRDQMFGQVQGQTRPGLNGEILRHLCIPLPPRTEQERIVTAAQTTLSRADQLPSETRKAVGRIRRLRQSILMWAFEGKLVDQDPKDEPAPILLDRVRQERATGTVDSKRPAGALVRETA